MSYVRPPLWDVMQNGEPYIPFDWQAEFIHANAGVDRLVAACGRRSGKSSAMRAEVVRTAFDPIPEMPGVSAPPFIYVIAPNYELTMKIWQPIWDLFVRDENSTWKKSPLARFKASHDKNRKLIELKNGVMLQAKSADDPASLQGDRVVFAVVDEAQDLNEEAWANFMPALLDSKGKMFAIGVTKGRGRFRSYWMRGQEGEDRYYSFSVPSTVHPNITEEELEVEREQGDLTDVEFRQQYLCEWVDDDSAVFKNPESVFTGSLKEPERGGSYIMGLDIGKVQDFTVAYIIDTRTLEVVAKDRFNGIDYTAQPARIANLYDKYNVRFIHMDTTGIGEAMYDSLISEGCAVVPFKFTNASKQALVNTLVREVERKNVILPVEDNILLREMKVFEASLTNGGLLKYEAPKGYHDDCVIALALAVSKAVKNRRIGQRATQKRYASWDGESNRRRAVMPPLPAVEPETVNAL